MLGILIHGEHFVKDSSIFRGVKLVFVYRCCSTELAPLSGYIGIFYVNKNNWKPCLDVAIAPQESRSASNCVSPAFISTVETMTLNYWGRVVYRCSFFFSLLGPPRPAQMRPGDLLGSRIPQIDIRDSASGDASPAGRLLVNYSTSSCDAAMDRVSGMRYGVSFFLYRCLFFVIQWKL